MPALDPQEAFGSITGSEQIVIDCAKSASLTARDVRKSIVDVLHNPDFNADDGDMDMLDLFANSVVSGDLEIISMHNKERDGAMKLELFKHPGGEVCENSCPTLAFGWLVISTLPPSRSTWILMKTDCLLVMQMDLSLFNWLSYG